jgi:hypothetical protein
VDGAIEKGHRERKRWVGEKGEGDGYLGRSGGRGEEACEGEGERTTRGIREASLILSAPLSALSCRERDGVVGSRGTAPQQQQQRQHPRPGGPAASAPGLIPAPP